MNKSLLQEFVKGVLSEAELGEIGELFIDGKWYLVEDFHDAFVNQYYQKHNLNVRKSKFYEDYDDYTTTSVVEFNAIKRRGNNFLVKQFDTKTLKILQEHVAEDNFTSKNIIIESVLPQKYIDIPVENFMNAKTFSELMHKNWLQRMFEQNLNEATYNSVREWYVDGEWYPVSRDDYHDAWAKRFLESHDNDPQFEDEGDYTNYFVKQCNAIRRHGVTFLVPNFSNTTLKILQNHLLEIEKSPAEWLLIGSLAERSNVRCMVQDLIEARTFHELDVAKGMF